MEHADDITELERGVRARQRSRYLRFSRPPQDKRLHESRKKLMKEKNAANFIREMVVFVMMLTLVCVVAYSKHLSAHFLLRESLHGFIVRGTKGANFEKAHSISDWHHWAQTTLLDAVYGTATVQPLIMKEGKSQGNNVLVGHPVLRAYRVRPEPCPSSCKLPDALSWPCHLPRCPSDMADIVDSLDNSSKSKYNMMEDLNQSRSSAPLTPARNVSVRTCEAPYIPTLCYQGFNQGREQERSGEVNSLGMLTSGGSSVWGAMAWYSTGGEVLFLNQSSKTRALSYLQFLEYSNWLDVKTRAVVVEMTVLNIPTSLFSSILLLLELPPSGGSFPSSKITSCWLFRYVTVWDNCVLACELLFVILVLVKLQSELSRIAEKRWHYFTWPWNYAPFLFCLTGVVYVACYIYRFKLIWDTVELLRNTFYEQFVSVSFLAAWDELIRSLVGMLVFLVLTTQGLRLLRYCPHLARFTAVYRRARREVILMMLLFSVLTGAFTSLGALLFGSLSMHMRSAWSSALSVVALATGIYRPADLEVEGSPCYILFSVVCSTLGFGLLTAYTVAMLTPRVHAGRHSDLLVMGKRELLRFCLQQLLLTLRIRQHSPVHEPEIQLPPECTLAEFEYQVEELLFRMNALTGTTNLPEKPTGYLTDSDQSQAVGDDGISSGGSEAGVEGVEQPANYDDSHLTQRDGEDGRLEQRVQKIEDKLYANEPYLAQLLKLDSIGSDILSQEKEKKLRSHLEMEIFRQLQMQRQETDAVPAEGDSMADPLVSSVAANYDSASDEGARLEEDVEKPEGCDLDLLHQTSSDHSPGSERALLHFSSDEPDVTITKIIGRGQIKQSKMQPTRARILPEINTTMVIANEVEVWSSTFHANPNFADNAGSTKKGQPSGTSDTSHKPRSSHRKTLSDASVMDRSDSLRASGKRKALDVAQGVERCHSLRLAGGQKHHQDLAAAKAMERSDSVQSTGKKSELPPKPTYAAIPAKDSKRSPKPPPLKIGAERVVMKADLGHTVTHVNNGAGFWGEGRQLGDSSSGSEQDGLNMFSGNGVMGAGGSSRRPQGQGRRNLRKTESRGKGKGAGTLTPTLLLDELSFTVHEPPRDLHVLKDVVVEVIPPSNE